MWYCCVLSVLWLTLIHPSFTYIGTIWVLEWYGLASFLQIDDKSKREADISIFGAVLDASNYTHPHPGILTLTAKWPITCSQWKLKWWTRTGVNLIRICTSTFWQCVWYKTVNNICVSSATLYQLYRSSLKACYLYWSTDVRTGLIQFDVSVVLIQFWKYVSNVLFGQRNCIGSENFGWDRVMEFWRECSACVEGVWNEVWMCAVYMYDIHGCMIWCNEIHHALVSTVWQCMSSPCTGIYSVTVHQLCAVSVHC